MKILKGLLFVVGVLALVLTSVFVLPNHFDRDLVYSILLFTAAGGVGVTTSVTLTYVPQYIFYDDGGNVPTSIRATVLGDGVIHDTVAAQIPMISHIRSFGFVANHHTHALANGLIKNKNLTIDFTTSAVGAIPVYGSSFEDGDAYMMTLQATVLANSGQEFSKFAYLAIPAMGATDYVNVEYEDGTVQRIDQPEFDIIAGFYQNFVAGQFIIDNIDGRIRKVQLIPAANRVVAVIRYAEAS